MKRRHFEQLRPVCPVCRTQNEIDSPLGIAQVAQEEAGNVIEGMLHCSHAACQREYPIIDGIPFILVGLRSYLSENILHVYARRDLTAVTESLLGDCCGPGSAFDTARQHLSSYAWDHYGEFDTKQPAEDARPGSVVRILQQGLDVAGDKPPGPVLDVGCSVGRSSFALAERFNDLVLGVDLNYPMLRLAADVLRSGVVRYPRRRVGLVYDQREFRVRLQRMENVDFWACDATALPFEADTFSAAVTLNTLDCVHSPVDLLASMARTLKPGSPALLACPYDWSTAATSVEAWLGGHSQRSAGEGCSALALRSLLTPGAHPQGIKGVEIAHEIDDLAWHVRLHDRSVVSYSVHLVVAKKTA